MEISNRPELTHLEVGDSLEIIQINALRGMIVPLHLNTRETVIVVQEGKAFLKAKNKEYFLERGSTLLVPEHMEHSLNIILNFKAVAIIAKESNRNINN